MLQVIPPARGGGGAANPGSLAPPQVTLCTVFLKCVLEKRKGGREGEEHRYFERDIKCPEQGGSEPTTQVSAFPGNQTGDLLVCGKMPKPLRHAGQG